MSIKVEVRGLEGEDYFSNYGSIVHGDTMFLTVGHHTDYGMGRFKIIAPDIITMLDRRVMPFINATIIEERRGNWLTALAFNREFGLCMMRSQDGVEWSAPKTLSKWHHDAQNGFI